MSRRYTVWEKKVIYCKGPGQLMPLCSLIRVVSGNTVFALKFWTPYLLKFKHPFYYHWMSAKWSRPWSDITFCGIWSGSTLLRPVCPNTFRVNTVYLKLTMLWGDSADNKLIFFIFFLENRIWHFMQIVSKRFCQILFSRKNKKFFPRK